MIHTLKEIRDNLRDTSREKQIDTLIDNFINLTINEVNDFHTWTFNRRKTTFSTVASTEDYLLPRDLDKIGILRQTDSPMRLLYAPDEVFYRHIPDPSGSSGNPKYYRLWEEEGVSTRLAEADTISVVSSSTADDSSFNVSIAGYVSTYRDSEVLTLNGTTAVSGTKTFAANRPLRISKSAKTTGTITVKENSGGTTLVTLAPEERSPRFRIIGLYPIPSSAITMYLEYYTRIRELVNDSDAPDFDEKWHWLIREGALGKIYQYQNNKELYAAAESRFREGLERMRARDILNVDYIPVIQRSIGRNKIGAIEISDDAWAFTF